ncbi:MAG TPA: multiheme c-type cytochrome [Acidobacteriota bacterium]|nr:multiheme c-type cytochrome [Acidobacteriota bacterium]
MSPWQRIFGPLSPDAPQRAGRLSVRLLRAGRKGALMLLLTAPALGLLWTALRTLPAQAAAPNGSAPASPQQSQTANQPQYVGIGRCASAPCHGNDAFPVWQEEDRHSKAYELLFNRHSRSIADVLELESPETSPRCLTCHSVLAPAAQRADSFDVSQGVGCEACHGPASQWRVPHTDESVPRESLVGMGFVPTKDLGRRAQQCLSCHLGDAERQVDHELIAAGHPELTFELDTFTARMPPHWERDASSAGARQWALGQAAALAQSMRLLAGRIDKPMWGGFPDFASFECTSCHHYYPSLARQRRGYEGRPGYPPVRPSRRIVLNRFLQTVEPGLQERLQVYWRAVVDGLHSNRSEPQAAREETRQAALDLALWAEGLSQTLQSRDFSASELEAAIRSISADAEALAAHGFRTAEQAKWAVDALYISYQAQSGPNPEIEQQIDRLESVLRGRYPSEVSD